MEQIDTYMLTTLLSASVILVIGICLLVISIPKEPGLRNYRISRWFLAGAYLILAAVGLWEVFNGGGPDPFQELMVFTLVAASFQAVLFTFSLITLIDMRYMTARRLWANIIPISLLSATLLIVFFTASEQVFYPVFYTLAGLYGLQLVYYITLFLRKHKRYQGKLDNFFSGNEYRRLRWIKTVFWLAVVVSVTALMSLFVSVGAYIVFTVGYTLFYICFAVKYINYVNQFYRFAAVVDVEPESETRSDEATNTTIRAAVERWTEQKQFLCQGITLAGLAQELNTNQFYLSRFINSEYGQNFRSWINSLRVWESIRLMEQDETLSITEIAERVGLHSLSTFYRQFSSVTGMPPSEYRKNMGKSRK